VNDEKAPDRYLNRELSWLAFNQRVLDEAADASTPLLDRARFAAIVASNLDEFFMVRVAALFHAIEEGTQPDQAGLAPARQLALVRERAHVMVDALYRLTHREILPALAEVGARIVPWADLDEHRRAALAKFFRQAIFPVLTPLAIDGSRPFPLLSSLTLNVALRLEPVDGSQEQRLAIVQVPPGLARLVPSGEQGSFVLLEELIVAHGELLFPGQAIIESSILRLARDAELELDDEGGRTQLEIVEKELRRRRRSDVVRIETSAAASEALVGQLRDHLDVPVEDVYRVSGPLDLRLLFLLADTANADAPQAPLHAPVSVLAGVEEDNLFGLLDERPLLLHHPYESYDPVLALVAQAADDPDVLAIKQTLYRTSVGSPFVDSLRRAATRNKQVTVLVELTARFDEERNIHWARALEEAGAQVIYGVRGYKTHAKICLIVRRSPYGLKRYVHLGTGNYNERTARVYTDFGLLTTAPAIVEDATAFFNAVTGYSDPPRMKKLVMAPTDLRRRFLQLIDRERRRALGGQRAEIVAKMNALTDGEIVDALYAASTAGVRIQLNVRGVCVLRPGIAGLSDNIEVVSIVDRFLEHSRIYYFFNGAAEDVFLASADWMTRNLDKRVELMFPVEDAEHKARILYALRAMFRDNVKARWLDANGDYARREPAPGDAAFRVQQHLQDETRRLAALAQDRAGITLKPEESGTRSATVLDRQQPRGRSATPP
jgi:polyphosphate kinase